MLQKCKTITESTHFNESELLKYVLNYFGEEIQPNREDMYQEFLNLKLIFLPLGEPKESTRRGVKIVTGFTAQYSTPLNDAQIVSTACASIPCIFSSIV